MIACFLRSAGRDAATFLHALRFTARVIHPRLPTRWMPAAVMDDGAVWTLDEGCELRVDGMDPSPVLREALGKLLFRRLWGPVLRYRRIACDAIKIHRRIKRDRASQPPETCLEGVHHGCGNTSAQTADSTRGAQP